MFEREREKGREFVRQRWRGREIEILGSGLFIGSLTKEMGTDIYWVLTTYCPRLFTRVIFPGPCKNFILYTKNLRLKEV